MRGYSKGLREKSNSLGLSGLMGVKAFALLDRVMKGSERQQFPITDSANECLDMNDESVGSGNGLANGSGGVTLES